MSLCDRDKNFIRLLQRSPDAGEGWRQVSNMVWPLVENFEAKELIETKEDGAVRYVRLSRDGDVIAKYF